VGAIGTKVGDGLEQDRSRIGAGRAGPEPQDQNRSWTPNWELDRSWSNSNKGRSRAGAGRLQFWGSEGYLAKCGLSESYPAYYRIIFEIASPNVFPALTVFSPVRVAYRKVGDQQTEPMQRMLGEWTKR
jgi:hypothetical protein